ncbi:MAG TPA: aldo/keto reductase, partial [Candidatus Parabacteroides intestinigallinarum]|nr:aldo/keto reductase [Candidatus Parabacteroides intestinigallinarum]
DLLLIHQPFGDYYGTYRAMEKAYKAGKARAIGLSNFYDARFVDLAENMEIKPAVVQLETHVFSQQVKTRELMKEYGTRLMAWSPLARGMNNLFGNETLKEIADRHGKDIAQICLKFLTDESIIVIPQSTKPERMRSNFALDDFELTDDEREAIRRLDAGHPFAADFNDPVLAKYLLGYDKQFNPDK